MSDITDRQLGLIVYGAWCGLHVTPCVRCDRPLVVLETIEEGQPGTTIKWMETKTPPRHGWWLMGEHHTSQRCQELQPTPSKENAS
jgi:hypothetical protein